VRIFARRNRTISAMIAAIVVGHLAGFGYLALVGWVVLTVTLASRGLTRYWIEHLDVTREFPFRRGRIGDSASGAVTVTNTGALPVPFVIVRDFLDGRVKVEGPRSKMGVLLAGRTMSFTYNVTFPRRGYFQFGPASIETGDLFGLFKKFRSTGGTDHALIYPKVLVLSRYDIASRRPVGDIRITARLFEDPLLVAFVREYQPGDSLRSIHWKATARTGALQTKVFEPTTVIGATIVLGFDTGTFAADPIGMMWSEMAVTLAASLAWHIYSKREKVGLLTNGADAAERMKFDTQALESARRGAVLEQGVPDRKVETPTGMRIETRRAEDQALRIFEALARVELSDSYPLAACLGDYAPRLARDASLIVIVHRVEPQLAAALENLRNNGFALSVLCTSDEKTYRETHAALAAADIPSQLVRDEQDMNEIVIRGI